MSYIAENLTQKMEAQTQWGNKYACIHTHTSYLFTQTSNLFFCLCMHHVSSLSSRHWKSVDVRQKTVVSASAILKYHEWQTKPQATKPFELKFFTSTTVKKGTVCRIGNSWLEYDVPNDLVDFVWHFPRKLLWFVQHITLRWNKEDTFSEFPCQTCQVYSVGVLRKLPK